jgi:hypothetical protein
VRSVVLKDQASETTAKANYYAVTPLHDNLADDTALIAVKENRCDTVPETRCQLEVLSTDSAASAHRVWLSF